MAEQKKTRTRSAAKPKKVAPAKVEKPVEEEPKFDESKLSKQGRQRYRELLAKRNRLDSEVKQALRLRSQIEAIDKEIEGLK